MGERTGTRSAGSPLLLNVIDGLWARIGPYLNIHFLGPDHLRLVTLPCHERMYLALAARDKTGMRQAIHEDLSSSAARILPLLNEPLDYPKREEG